MKTALLAFVAYNAFLATAFVERHRVKSVKERVVARLEANRFSFPGYHDLEAAAPGGPPAGPHVGNCSVFPQDNVWNTPIDALPRHPKSDAYIQSMGAATKVHPDFSSGRYGIPFTEIPADTKPVKIAFRYGGESDKTPYLIPPDAPIEGGGDAPGDRHVIAIDPRTCMLYELWASYKINAGQWKAGSGAVFNLKSNDLRKSGDTSADAAGLPIFPGLVRYEEIEAGEIDHALRFTIPKTQANFIWPARHQASNDTNPNTPPMGLRLRLKADFDISNYSKTNRIILKALKKYGMFLADNGTGIFISGVPSKSWDNDDLHKLGGVTAADFEAVDESDLQKSTNSAAVDPAAVKR